jgi:hypothetical protein
MQKKTMLRKARISREMRVLPGWQAEKSTPSTPIGTGVAFPHFHNERFLPSRELRFECLAFVATVAANSFFQFFRVRISPRSTGFQPVRTHTQHRFSTCA